MEPGMALCKVLVMVLGGRRVTVRGAAPGTGCGRELETEHDMGREKEHGMGREKGSYMVRTRVLEKVLVLASKAVPEIALLSHN